MPNLPPCNLELPKTREEWGYLLAFVLVLWLIDCLDRGRVNPPPAVADYEPSSFARVIGGIGCIGGMGRKEKQAGMRTIEQGVPLPKPPPDAPKAETDSGFGQTWWINAEVRCRHCTHLHGLDAGDKVYSLRTRYFDDTPPRGTGNFRCCNCGRSLTFTVALSRDGESVFLRAEIMGM